MMLNVDVIADKYGLARIEARFGSRARQTPLILKRAITKTGRYVHTRVIRQLSSATGVQQKIIRKRYVRLRIDKSMPPSATITIKDRGVPLILLHPRKTPVGIQFRTPAGGSQIRPGSFKAVMPTGNVGIFKRRRVTRLPIDEQYHSVMVDEARKQIGGIRVDAGARLKLEIGRQIEVMLRRKR